jgi:hypothetical protein
MMPHDTDKLYEAVWTTKTRVESLEDKIDRLGEEFKNYVRHERFRPVEMIAYGLIGGIGLSVLGAFMAMILTSR